MPGKLLFARTEGDEFVVRVHLDETKLAWDLVDATDEIGRPVRVRTGDPYPGPEWVFERRFNKAVPPAQAIEETVRLAAGELLRRQPPQGSAHPDEGKRLDLAAVAVSDPLPAPAPPGAESQGDAKAQEGLSS